MSFTDQLVRNVIELRAEVLELESTVDRLKFHIRVTPKVLTSTHEFKTKQGMVKSTEAALQAARKELAYYEKLAATKLIELCR